MGINIRLYRESLQMTQEEFAEKVFKRSPKYLGMIERGERNLSMGKVREYADNCGTTPFEILKKPPPEVLMELGLAPL